MKSPLNILIVEDRDNHIADAKAMLEAELPRLPIQVNVLWATNYEGADYLLKQADAVITDVFFPLRPGANAEEPNGRIVVDDCLRKRKPVVWITSTYHHGAKTNHINDWGRLRGLEMFDCYIPGNEDGEAVHKPWKHALYGLFYLAVAMDEGYCVIKDGKFRGRERTIQGKNGPFTFPYDVNVAVPIINSLFFSKDVDPQFYTVENYPVLYRMAEMGFYSELVAEATS